MCDCAGQTGQAGQAGAVDQAGRTGAVAVCGCVTTPDPAADDRPWLDRYRAEVATVGSGLLVMVGALLGWLGAPEAYATAAYAGAIGIGGLLVWPRALVSIRARTLDMNVLMSVAAFGAAALGEWGEGAAVFFLFALGGLLESRSLARTRRSIRDLMGLAPETARVLSQGVWTDVPLAKVRIGDRVSVRPGERIPVDGVIVAGSSAFDEAAITGESIPAEKTLGDTAFAGTLNALGLVEIEAGAVATGSTLARIVYLVEEAQASRAPVQAFIDRFSRYYTPTVIGLAVVIAFVPTLLSLAVSGSAGMWQEWIRRALVMLVISCPCALVISTPVSIISAVTRASRDGVLVKGGAFLETAAKVRAIAFDKTGTLTTGRPKVAELRGFEGVDADTVLAVAGALEAHSNHPLARAVVHAAADAEAGGAAAGNATADISGYREIPGVGVSGILGGVEWTLTSPTSARGRARGREPAHTREPAHACGLSDEVAHALDAFERRGLTTLVLACSGGGDAPAASPKVVGLIALADEVRPESASAMARLKHLGIGSLVMLTGDNERVAEAVAAAAGLTGHLARLLPAEKTDAIRALQDRHGAVAMVGDGINDAPALAASDIGIAMGAAGTDTALEVADVALMRDDLSALPGLIGLGRRTMRTIYANVAFSILVKAAFLVLALAGTATLWMAVFADTGVSLLVILNGMRLLVGKRR